MVKVVVGAITGAVRKLFTNWRLLLVALAIYLALLAVVYLFFAVVKEATKVEVFLTVAVLPVVMTLLFFSLQSLGLSFTRLGPGPGPALKGALQDCWKLALVSLPLILLAVLVAYLFPSVETAQPVPGKSASPSTGRLLALVLKSLLLYFALPLLTIHLWIRTVRDGLDATFKELRHGIQGAFSPQPVLTYLMVAAVFGVIAYLLFFTRASLGSEWGELWLFGVRLALALLTIFIGWLVLLGAMAEVTTRQKSQAQEA